MLPHDVNLEERLLAMLLCPLSARDTAAPVIATGLRPEHFFRQDWQPVARACIELHAAGVIPNTLLVSQRLTKAELDAALGIAGLERVTSCPVYSVESIAVMVRSAIDLAWRRSRIIALEGYRTRLCDLHGSVEALHAEPDTWPSTHSLALTQRPFITDVSIMDMPDTPQLIRGLIPGNALTLLSGPSGVGKTHLVLAIAMAVTQGASLFGRFDVESPGHVLYIGLEGAAGLKHRVIAAKMAQGCPLDHPLGIFFHFDAFSLLDNEQIDGVLRRIPPGVDIKLVVVDTYGKAILPGNENDTHDAGLAVEGMTRLRRETGAAVLGLHHLGANGDRERGNTALKAGMDAAIRIMAAPDGLKRVICDKQRDAAPFDDWHFRLEPTGPSVVPVLVDVSHREPADDVSTDSAVPDVMLDHARRVLRSFPTISNTQLAGRLSGRKQTCLAAARQAKAERGAQ